MADRLNATLFWESALRFSALPGSGHRITVDSPSRPGHAGPSPMELLLIGVAGCTAMDVVAILEKMREPLAGLAGQQQRLDNHQSRQDQIGRDPIGIHAITVIGQ